MQPSNNMPFDRSRSFPAAQRGVVQATADSAANVQLKQSLRGMPLHEQEAALAPPADWAPVQTKATAGGRGAAEAATPKRMNDERAADAKIGGAGHDQDKPGSEGKVPAGQQPGPHVVAAGGAGKWLLSVDSKAAAFSQRVRIGGEVQQTVDAEVHGGEVFEVHATGDWTVSVLHSPPAGCTWAKPRLPGEWYPSSHKKTDHGPDALTIATEDFKDSDFDDLMLSAARDTAPAAEEDDGAYLVSAETKVVGAATAYDLIIGASASGRLDVVMNAAMCTPGELGALDRETLSAMAEHFASFSGKVSASTEHAEKRAALLVEVAAWQQAIQRALANVKEPGRP